MNLQITNEELPNIENAEKIIKYVFQWLSATLKRLKIIENNVIIQALIENITFITVMIYWDIFHLLILF